MDWLCGLGGVTLPLWAVSTFTNGDKKPSLEELLEKQTYYIGEALSHLHHCSAHPGTDPSLLLWVFIPQTQGVLLAQEMPKTSKDTPGN